MAERIADEVHNGVSYAHHVQMHWG
jgi:hypothetical protein